MIQQIESARPKLLIYTNLHPEWYTKPKNWEELDKWFFSYVKSSYIPIVRFEYLNMSDTLLIADDAKLMKKPSHTFWISIYKLRIK